VVAKLTATPSVTEGGEITYTITLTNKDGLPINNHSALTFTLSDGKTVITVPANGTVGTATVTAPDNVYVGTNDPVVKSIATVEGADVGKFEQLTLDKTRSAPPSPTSQVRHGQRRRPGQGHHHRRPDLGGRERQTDLHRAHQPAAGHDLVVTLSNNAQVTIKAGDTSAPYEHAAQGDDVYNDAARSAWASSRLWTSTVAPSRTCSWAAREGHVTDTTDEVSPS
jgi:surface adhesion protein